MSVILNFQSETIEEIRQLFLGLTVNNRKDFYISLDDILTFVGAYDRKTKAQKEKEKNHTITRFLDAYHFQQDIHYKIYVNPKDNRSRHYLFTDDAFKLMCLCLQSNQKIRNIYKYFYELENDYIIRLQSPQQVNQKIYDEIAEFSEKIKQAESRIKQKKIEWQELVELTKEEVDHRDQLEHEVNQRYANDDALVKRINTLTVEKMTVSDSPLSYEDYLYMTIINKLFLRSIYVVFMNPKTMSNFFKKQQKEAEKYQERVKMAQKLGVIDAPPAPDEDADLIANINLSYMAYQDADLSDEYNSNGLPSPSEPSFYTISTAPPKDRSKLASIIYVEKRTGLDNLRTYLNDKKNNYITPKSEVWLISLSDLKDAVLAV